ncbi:hypothetical protein V1478_007312 [Vespula squamosa]|uniref:Uncharacterized protein n=1 Tax=Vespula squamosa TaxID=30214 RepID=A0ABD2B2S0_VESSQ
MNVVTKTSTSMRKKTSGLTSESRIKTSIDRCQIWKTRKELIKSPSYLTRDWIQSKSLYLVLQDTLKVSNFSSRLMLHNHTSANINFVVERAKESTFCLDNKELGTIRKTHPYLSNSKEVSKDNKDNEKSRKLRNKIKHMNDYG